MTRDVLQLLVDEDRAFIRNDNAPERAMAAVIIGECVSFFGDWFFVFPLGMGMKGAAIATVTGTTAQILVLGSHFSTKKCSLRLVKSSHVLPAIRETIMTGFGTAILDLGVVILPNNQINRYGSAVALAVYGVVSTAASLIQVLFNGVGQALQPIVFACYAQKNAYGGRSFSKHCHQRPAVDRPARCAG